ncbi:MYB-like transcription factor etc1 [Castilleja foliolosa]|uniref:MYB-like transcription factor etc1 n=1 Tax=Castilleja foliolosa TaxID=1961234 RepID=A0ABD3CFM0_9LAMI
MSATSENSSSDDNYSGSQEVKMNQSQVLHFSKDEEALIIRMYKLVGERWTLIAGRIPGRTAEEIEKYWVSKNSPNGYFK